MKLLLATEICYIFSQRLNKEYRLIGTDCETQIDWGAKNKALIRAGNDRQQVMEEVVGSLLPHLRSLSGRSFLTDRHRYATSQLTTTTTRNRTHQVHLTTKLFHHPNALTGNTRRHYASR
jgi:hypothetical protein